MPADYGCIRHVRPFLNQRQWSCLCVALRLPPIAAFSNECERLISLDPDRPASSGITPRNAKEGALEPMAAFGRDGAYILDKRHLHISLPWREPPSHTLMDGTAAAQLLARIFISGAHCRVLESINVHVRVPIPGMTDLLSVINHLIIHHASSLTSLSLTCEFVSQASQMLHLAQQQLTVVADAPHHVGNLITTGGAVDANMPASAPGHLQTRYHTSHHTEDEEEAPPIAFDIRGCFFPELVYLNISAPVMANDMTRFAKLMNLSIRFLGFDEIGLWLTGFIQADNESSIQQLQSSHIDSYDTILKQACCTVEVLNVSGDLNSRRNGRIFTTFKFLPQVRSLSLGWTCEEELRSLLMMLRPGSAPLRDMLNAAQEQSALYKSFQLACKQLNWNDDAALGASLADPTCDLRIPPKLPILRRLSFSGPLRMGLSDLHLDLYTLVNKASGRGVHFQYGLFVAHARRVIKFRLDFCFHPFFALYRDVHSRLHHLYVKGIAGDDGIATPFGKSRPSTSTTKRAVAESAANDWSDLLRYHHINPNTSSRQSFRIAQRADFRQRRLLNDPTIPPAAEWATDATQQPPTVGPQMTALDLFRLEMWHLPVVCQRDFADTDQASELWTTYLTQEDRDAWEIALTTYKIARLQPGPLSFDKIQPWWTKQNSQTFTLAS